MLFYDEAIQGGVLFGVGKRYGKWPVIDNREPLKNLSHAATVTTGV